jgi:hypothetical protein
MHISTSRHSSDALAAATGMQQLQELATVGLERPNPAADCRRHDDIRHVRSMLDGGCTHRTQCPHQNRMCRPKLHVSRVNTAAHSNLRAESNMNNLVTSSATPTHTMSTPACFGRALW